MRATALSRMIRHLALLGFTTFGVMGCSVPASDVRLVPTATVYRAVPQPTTDAEFRAAEHQGFVVAATGQGPAFGIDDLPTELWPGERLHVLRVNPQTGEVLVRRLDSDRLARVSREAVEVRGTTYLDRR